MPTPSITASAAPSLPPGTVFEKKNYNSVDGLRAISILLVIIYHCFISAHLLIGDEQFLVLLKETPIYLHWVWHGDKGVDVFFVISGFLIGSMLFKEHHQSENIQLGNFYWRRFVRLTPVYWLAMLIHYPFLGNNENVWANILYINNFLSAEDMFMGWTWSLAVEEQFYILFPLTILFIFPRFRSIVALLGFLILASFVIRWIVHMNNPELANLHPSQFMFPNLAGFTIHYFDVIYSNLHTRFGAIACGCLIAYLHVHHATQISSFVSNHQSFTNLLLLFGLGLIVLITAMPHFNPDFVMQPWQVTLYSVVHRNIFSIGVAIVLLLSLYPRGWSKPVASVLSLPFWKPIARFSYSMYLFHILVVYTIGKNLKPNILGMELSIPQLLAVDILLVLIISTAISAVTYYAVERPIMNLRKPTPYHA